MDVLVIIPNLNIKIILEMQNILNEDTFIKSILYLFSVILKEYKIGEKKFTNTSVIKEIIISGHICEYLKNIKCINKSTK